MIKTIDIYTELEKDFLEKACNLLEMPYKAKGVTKPMIHTLATIEGDTKQFEMLTSLMAYNYKRNF